MPKNPHANFRPTLESYSGQGAFRFWCQMALPLTYDDSLSYYELLNKVVTYLNNTIKDVGTVEDNVAALNEAYGKLEDYVNTYFDEIDIEAELRNVLDAMAEDGSLDSLLDPLVAERLGGVVAEQINDVVANQIDDAVSEQIGDVVNENLPNIVPDAVGNWLEENITPTTPVVDNTLTIPNAAADAKTTGDKITNLNRIITAKPYFNSSPILSETASEYRIVPTITFGKRILNDGTVEDNASYDIASFTAVKEVVYRIVAFPGSHYDKIRLIDLSVNGTGIAYYLPASGNSETVYLHDFSGDVKISYRNTQSTVITETINHNLTDYRVYEDAKMLKYADNLYITREGRKQATSAAYTVYGPIAMNAGDIIEYTARSQNNHASLSETNVGMTKFTELIGGKTAAGDNTVYPYSFCAPKTMYVAICVSTNTISKARMWKKPDIILQPKIKWWAHFGINNNGDQITADDNCELSYPIQVRKGDYIHYHSYNMPDKVVVAYSNKWQNTYGDYAIPTYEPIVPSMFVSGNPWQDAEFVSDRDGYIVVFSKTANYGAYEGEIDLSITRITDNHILTETVETSANDFYSVQKHFYTEKDDFVPNVASKRTNDVLIYEGDDKKSANHLVNAVVYPDGRIVGCRNYDNSLSGQHGGDVVIIDNDGTETSALHIYGARDWRLCFMDTNHNVYVSPHSGMGNTNTPLSVTNRGLYRLEYGETAFEKVIPLYDTSARIITKWTANTSYTIGQVVFNSSDALFYECIEAHTSGSSFDSAKWKNPDMWESSQAYTIGNIVTRYNYYFVCKTAHTSGNAFDQTKWIPATACMNNDDTIWNMCEDDRGNLYAGVYSHSVRANPAIYKSTDGGITWNYDYNFIYSGLLPLSSYGGKTFHIHTIAFNEFNNSLYACVGGCNTILKSSDYGETWKDLHVTCYYGQGTALIAVPDGLLIGSDGHYSCGITKLLADDKTYKATGRTIPGYYHGIRRSDLTGWIYAFTRTDFAMGSAADCPPITARDTPSELTEWLNEYGATLYGREWSDYNKWAEKYYPEDAIFPSHAVIMVSRDNGDSWEVIHYEDVNTGRASMAGYVTVGQFCEGEILIGRVKSVGTNPTSGEKNFVKPLILSEGKKKRTTNGFDLTGEIFIKTNSSAIVQYDN